MSQLQTRYTVGDFFRLLNILFFALMVGVLSCTLIFVMFRMTDKLPTIDVVDRYAIYVTPVLLVAFYFISQKVYTWKLNKAARDLPLLNKADIYRSCQIFRMACFEIGVFANIIAYGLSGNKWLLIPIVIGILVLISWKPTALKMIKDMDLNHHEALIMQQNSSVLYEDEMDKTP